MILQNAVVAELCRIKFMIFAVTAWIFVYFFRFFFFIKKLFSSKHVPVYAVWH